MKLLLALMTVAHGATWWKNFCGASIARFPEDYRHESADWLDQEISRLEIKEVWGKLDVKQADDLKVMRDEKEYRRRNGIESASVRP